MGVSSASNSTRDHLFESVPGHGVGQSHLYMSRRSPAEINYNCMGVINSVSELLLYQGCQAIAYSGAQAIHAMDTMHIIPVRNISHWRVHQGRSTAQRGHVNKADGNVHPDN